MSVTPRKPIDKVQWFEDHLERWNTNAVAIGTTVADVTALSTKTEVARAAYDAYRVLADDAKAALDSFEQAVATMSNAGAAIIEQVRTKARSAGDSVYPLANIPAPANPTPAGQPGTPRDFKVTLNVDGSLTITFKCSNPATARGTIYQVWRKNADDQFAYLGGCGTKSYTDTTIPAGVTSLVYQIQAVRSTAVGEWAQFNVNFGQSGATVTPLQPKIAA